MQARELLAGHQIIVPAAFTTAQLQQLSEQGDVRLRQAAIAAQEGQVIQYLAGVPDLLARYRNAPPAARALIHAAMDACRLGVRPALPQDFLEAAALGYLTDHERNQIAEDWLEEALAYTAAPCRGISGPLTRIRPGLSNNQSVRQRGPLYRLADYLLQHGRRSRRDQTPPDNFWIALCRYADPDDLVVVADAAEDRGLYRYAALLYKEAALVGRPYAAASLIRLLHRVQQPSTLAAADWAAAQVSLDGPEGVGLPCWERCGRQVRVSRPARCWLVTLPLRFRLMVLRVWLPCWMRCGWQVRVSRPARCWLVTLPLRFRLMVLRVWLPCWMRCGRQVRVSRSARCWLVTLPLRFRLMVLRVWLPCWMRCGRQVRARRSARCWLVTLPLRFRLMVLRVWLPCWMRCGRQVRVSRPLCLPAGPPLRFRLMVLRAWLPCWMRCGRQVRVSRSARCWLVTLPLRFRLMVLRAWLPCWMRCGWQVRVSRSLCLPAGPSPRSRSMALRA